MPGCAVFSCKNRTGGFFPNRNVIYHSFPKNETRRKQWIHKCKRADVFNVQHSKVCSLHFKKEDYVRDLESELLGSPLRKKRRLLESALPTLHLEAQKFSNLEEVKTDRENRNHGRISRKNGLKRLELLNEHNTTDTQPTSTNSMKGTLEIYSTDTSININDSKQNTIDSLAKQLHSAKQKYTLLKWKYNGILKKNRNLAKINSSQEKTCGKYSASKILNSVFSKVQIEVLRTKSRPKQWSSQDITKAITLRALSKRAYSYMRCVLSYPLPSFTTLKEWTRGFKCSPGMITEVVQLLEYKFKDSSPMERLCALSFDEMNLDGHATYDESLDLFYPPTSNMIVVMAKGLCYSWKQPVHFDFDKKMDKQLINEILMSLGNAGIIVKSLTCDLGTKNTGFWKEIGVTMDTTQFRTDNGKNIYVFPDVPHIIKCLRNALLDHGLLFPSGVLLKMEFILDLLKQDNQDHRLFHHLNLSDLQVKGQDRQRVSPATRLFSAKTAKAILTSCKLQKHTVCYCVEIADFIELINDWFDVFNAYVQVHTTNPNKNAYGMDLPRQNSILDKVVLRMREIQVPLTPKKNPTTAAKPSKKKSLKSKRRALLPFQKGFIMASTSLKLLFNDILQYKVKYLRTSTINQDALENLFGQIRGQGKYYSHPPANEAKNRLRLLLLGKNGLLPESCPVQVSDNMDFVSSFLLETLNEKSSDNNGTKKSTELVGTSFATEGERYVAGYIASKIRRKYPDIPILGTPTGQLPPECRDDTSFVSELSFGGLTEPTKDWILQYRLFESVFEILHGKTGLKYNSAGIIVQLKELLRFTYPEISEEVTHLYSRTRSFIRLRNINQIISDHRKQSKTSRDNNKLKQWTKSGVLKIVI